MKKSEEFIEFSSIRNTLCLSDTNLFTLYLKDVFKDLIDRSESNKKYGISFITFLDYVKLPSFIAEKLFNAFDKDCDTYLNLTEFTEEMYYLFFGNFKQTAKIIFNVFDFDNDGEINYGDVKILLSHLPLKSDNHEFQMESLEEIDELLKNNYFKPSKDDLESNKITVDSSIK